MTEAVRVMEHHDQEGDEQTMSDFEKYLDEAKELTKNAKKQAESISSGVSGKVQGILQDARAGKEIRQGIAELEALPETESSIVYRMELETALSYLRNLDLVVSDKRMDKDSAIEEIRRVMDKVQPVTDPQAEGSDEQIATENVKAITYKACERALEAIQA